MRSRVRRSLTAAFAAVVSATLLSVAALPAAAAPPTDPGVGGGSGAGGGGYTNPPPGTSYKCGTGSNGLSNQAMYRSRSGIWERFYEASYSECVGQGSLKQNYDLELCQSGFLVYRFYGTYNDFMNKSAAMTRSRSNTTGWCQGQFDRPFTFPTTSPLDYSPGSNPGLPWLNSAYWGTNGNQAANGQDSLWSIDAADHWLPSRPTKVTGPSCESKQTSKTMATYYAEAEALVNSSSGAARQAAIENLNLVKSFIGNMYWNASNQGDGRLAAWARSEIGVSTMSGYRFSSAAWKDKANAPARNDGGDSYFASSLVFDDRNCASPTMFSASSDSNPTDRVYTGTCYIPLMRTKVNFKTTKNVTTVKWLPMIYGLNNSDFAAKRGFGERFGTHYGSSQYTAAQDGSNPDFATDVNMGTKKVASLSTGQQQAMLGKWREMMGDNYRSWSTDMYGGSGVKQEQAVPANSGMTPGVATVLNKAQAEAELEAYSRCRVGTQALFNSPDFGAASVTGGQVDLNVADQKVYQVSPTEATITVTPSALKCQVTAGGAYGACPAEANAALTELTWSTNLDSVVAPGSGGLRLCKVTDVKEMIPSSCDGVWSAKQTGSSTMKASETIKVRFVNPTKASDKLRLQITGVSAKYSYVRKSDGLVVTGYNPVTGAKYTVSSGVLTKISESPASVNVAGSPVDVTKAGSGASATYTATFPVIGAVTRS